VFSARWWLLMYEMKHVALKPYNTLKKFNFKVTHPIVHCKLKDKME